MRLITLTAGESVWIGYYIRSITSSWYQAMLMQTATLEGKIRMKSSQVAKWLHSKSPSSSLSMTQRAFAFSLQVEKRSVHDGLNVVNSGLH